MTRRTWIAAGLLAMAAMTVPAFAAKGTVALIPASVTNGAAGNGPVVTEALRANLEKHGFTVLPAGNVESALKEHNLSINKRLTDSDMVEVRKSAGADYVIYPRVLSVGQSLSAEGTYQANILVNPQGKASKAFLGTTQVGQVFRPGRATKSTAVIGHGDADTAAQKLLAAFYKKVE